jgi:uncharacterized membrane protein
MPYEWTQPIGDNIERQMDLWPFGSLPNKGFAIFIMTTFMFLTLPLYTVMGTAIFWGLFPFIIVAVWGMWFALRKNFRDRSILERLSIGTENCNLVRQNPKGDTQTWTCNPFWVRVHLHETGGPVPNYVTLSGNGREVEIGAFLSEDERKALYQDLAETFRMYR